MFIHFTHRIGIVFHNMDKTALPTVVIGQLVLHELAVSGHDDRVGQVGHQKVGSLYAAEQ
jgi:hypothetical protein